MRYVHPVTYQNYNRLKDIVLKHNMALVCVQYPLRGIAPLKKMLRDEGRILFVSTQRPFMAAFDAEGYDYVFYDNFGGGFGHCTSEGNRLLAETVARPLGR